MIEPGGTDAPDPDPGSGGHDLPEQVCATTVGQALEAIGELARQVYAAACDDSVGWTTTQLHEQALSAQQALNSLGAVRSVRIAQYAQTRSRGYERGGIAGRGGAEDVLEFVPDELAPSFAWGPRQADHQVEDALHAVVKTPGLLDTAGRGELDPWRIGLVTGELQDASAATCRKVERDLLAEGITSWTGSRTRRRARAAVHRHEPAAEKKVARKRARERINVCCDPGQEPGTTDWHATLWTKDAHQAYAAVDELARQMHQATTTGKTLGQCRADAMCDLILGNATVTTQATLLVPVHPGTPRTPGTPGTPGAAGGGVAGVGQARSSSGAASGHEASGAACDAFGLPTSGSAATSSHGAAGDRGQATGDQGQAASTEGPATPATEEAGDPAGVPADPTTKHQVSRRRGLEDLAEQWLTGRGEAIRDVDVPGFGFLLKHTVIAVLKDLGTTITAALVDQTTGALLGTSCQTYRPATRIRRQVELRDRHCRFPGCDRPARWCDADHVERWPDGPTDVTNLQLLCRHHHRVKHETAWTVTMDPDGTCHWEYRPHGAKRAGEVDRTGRVFITRPGIVDVIADTDVIPAIPGAVIPDTA